MALANASRFGEVACDHLDPRPLPQPAGQRRRGAVGQEIDHSTLLQGDNDRAVTASAALCPVVDTDDAGLGLVRQRQSVEQAQHGVGAGRRGQPGQQPRTGFAAQCSARPALPRPAGMCAGRRAHQWRHAFGESPTGTIGVAAVETAYAQADPDPPPEGGKISRAPTIAAVHGPAPLAATRAAPTAAQAAGNDL